MGNPGDVAAARKAALAAGREFHDRLRAYEVAIDTRDDPAKAEREFARDLKEEVLDILERFVARQEREGQRP